MEIPAGTYRGGMVWQALPRVGVPAAVTRHPPDRDSDKRRIRGYGGATTMGGRSTVGIRAAGLLLLALLGMTAGGVLGKMPVMADWSPVPVAPVMEWAVDASW
ncbi:hypothetical protein Asi02nite_03130 [Asanoa siamensis]|uniref:Uncharacterized protein n=2 Tax=Asanoa siamensis TaxID=926357 RepID=A0ABQ4CHM2_9ACTN|nr:hypothetical protein Asi02nite_03130 [Asanoa siamensis]